MNHNTFSFHVQNDTLNFEEQTDAKLREIILSDFSTRKQRAVALDIYLDRARCTDDDF